MKGNDLQAKNKVMCTCGKCPTYNDCTKGKRETMFFSVGKFPARSLKKSLPLSDLSGYPIMRLSKGYYCMSGRKKNSGGCNFYFFLAFVGKNDPHSGVLAGFLRSGGGKVWGKSNLDLKAFDGHWARGKSAVFWHLRRLLGVFSTRNETGGFTGFSL